MAGGTSFGFVFWKGWRLEAARGDEGTVGDVDSSEVSRESGGTNLEALLARSFGKLFVRATAPSFAELACGVATSFVIPASLVL